MIMDPTIITLSSIPPRFAHLGPTLDSLLRQTLPAEQIILYVPDRYRRFPDWDGTIPVLPDGVTLRRVATDYGPATKILPALQDFAGQDVDILFCDDDMLYDPGWHQRVKTLRDRHPKAALCDVAHHLPGAINRPHPRMQRWSRDDLYKHRASRSATTTDPPALIRRSGYADVFEGWAGVMVRPQYFDDRVFNIPSDLWMVDDPWLSGHLALRGVPIWTSADSLPPKRRIHVQRDIAPLFFEIFDGKTRQDSEQACVNHYRALGIWDDRPAPPVSQLRRLARAALPHHFRAALLRLFRRRP
ncbi:MAG: glycosyltransferase family A protein [Paracoccaceae bacterium]